MAGDESTQTNIAVLVAQLDGMEAALTTRLDGLERALHEYNTTLSNTRERVNYLDRDKASREEFKEIRDEQNRHGNRLTSLSERLSWITIGMATLSLIASAIAAYVGKLP